MATTAQVIQFLLSPIAASGITLSGGQAFFFAAGTSTPKAVWIDRNKTTEAANPYTLAPNGTAQLYADGLYRVVIKDSNGATKYDWDYLPFVDYDSDLGALTTALDAKTARNVSDYESLAAAVAAIGSTPATLAFKTDQTLTAPLTVPSTLELLPLDGAVIRHGVHNVTYAGSMTRWPACQIFDGTGAVSLSGIGTAYPQWWGVKTGSGVNYQTAMDKCITSTAKVLRFPPGVYQAYINNSKSDRTFIFDEGAIIDGVVHLATGTGPEFSQPLTIVENVRVIGTIASTVRVGGYYAKHINVDKIRITGINAAYVNQTAEGGTKGVHFSFGTKDVEVGEILCESATAATYALGVDTGTVVDADHKPTDIHIGKLTVKNCTQSAIRTANTVRLKIDEVTGGYGTYNGCEFNSDEGLYIGRIHIDGTGTGGALSGIYVLNGASAEFGTVVTHHCSGIGFYVNNSPKTRVDYLETYNNTLDGARFLSQVTIGSVRAYSNTLTGINLAGSSLVKIERAEVYSNGTQGIYNNAAHDTTINEITAYNNAGAAGYGLFINNSQRFTCDILRATENVQGLRYIGNTDCSFGVISTATNSNADIALSGTNSGFSMLYATYTTITGGTLYAIPNFRGGVIPTITGAGAPASTPYVFGMGYLDTTNNKWYKAKGTASSADWLLLN